MPRGMFCLQVLERDGLTHVKVSGEVCMWTADWLAGELQTLIDEGVPGIVIDLSEVDVIDVAGIRVLLHARRVAMNSGTHLLVGSTSPTAQRTLDATRSWAELTDSFDAALTQANLRGSEPEPV